MPFLLVDAVVVRVDDSRGALLDDVAVVSVAVVVGAAEVVAVVVSWLVTGGSGGASSSAEHATSPALSSTATVAEVRRGNSTQAP